MTCKVLTPEEAASRNITGVTAPLMLVDGVWSGSAGSMAGIERFDIVQRKGGLWLRENGQTYGGCVAYPAAGSNTLSVEVWRNGRWQAKTLRWP